VAQLFQPFSRINETAGVGGSGLGLVICRELARLMDGDIHLETAPGKGARFEVFFAADEDGGQRRTSLPYQTIGLVAPEGPLADFLIRRLTETGLQVRLARENHQVREAEEVVLECTQSGLRVQGTGEQLDWPIREGRLAELLDQLAGFNPAPQAMADVGSEGPSGQRQRILVAEDNPVNARVVSDVLATEGYQVTVVDDGRAVLSALSFSNGTGTADRSDGAGSYSAILMDRYMPEMDGLAATRALREAGFRDLPVIGLTAAASEEERQACLSAGMDRVVIKDGDPAALLAAIRSLLGSRGG